MQVLLNLTPDLYKQIDSTAKSIGKSVNDFLVDKLSNDFDDKKAQEDLENFLAPRITAAKQGKITDKTIDEIVEESFKKAESVQK